MADEYVEPVDGDFDQVDREDEQRRASWLPWVVLLIAVVIIAWLFWRYAQAPGSADGDSAAVLTAASVPDVVGMTRGAASDAITRSGLVPDQDTAFSSDAVSGTVVSQAPSAGTKLTKGGLVVMVVAVDVGESTGVAEGMDEDGNRVPNVVGMTELRADELLTNEGYRVSVTQGYSSSRRRGIIYDQLPDAGEYAGTGTTVHARVSLGPAPPGKVQVPNVIGAPVKQATRELERAGLDPRSMVQYHPEYSEVVFQQNPAAGVLAPVGSRVFILSGE